MHPNPAFRQSPGARNLAFELRIDSVDGTWKLSQNKDAPARRAAGAAVTGRIGVELAALAALMRDTAKQNDGS